MILITSANYVNVELQAEFGRIPPTFLPLGGKRLYEHQVRLFDDINKRKILSIPESYNLSSLDEKKIDCLGLNTLRIPEDLTLGESIVYAMNMNLPINDELIILHGDTYFNTLDIGVCKDTLFVSKADSYYNWTYLDDIVQFNSENDFPNESNLIVNGLFRISDPYLLTQCIIKEKSSFIDGLKRYLNEKQYNIIRNDSWLDFGIVSNYFNSRKKMTTERSFNELIIKNGYVEKRSDVDKKILGEINWFENFPKELILSIPRFYSSENKKSYKTEYLCLNTISELFVFGELPIHVWENILTKIKSFIEILHTFKSKEHSKINYNYSVKTKSRLNKFIIDRELNIDKKWIFNGKNIGSINEILESINNSINVKDIENVFIHGDFCFSNIMYDFRSNSIKTFDSRGMDFENKITVYGDQRYDYAKLFHSVIGLYDFIIAGCYECEYKPYKIEFNIDVPANIHRIQQSFIDIYNFPNFKEMIGITIHLFFSMLPLHNDSILKQNVLLANAFRLYEKFEGTD